jgi:hypothetical protein
MMELKDCQIPLNEFSRIIVRQSNGEEQELPNDKIFVCKKAFKKTGYTCRMYWSFCLLCEKDDKVFANLCNKLIEYHKRKSLKPYQQLSIFEMGENFIRAIGRASKEGFKKVEKKIYIERQMCCSICGGKGRCPYCGCFRKPKAWLKSEESCPNPQTYPNLKKYPPRNYWAVCDEMTSVIIPAREEIYLNRTIENLLANATGNVEVIVILDGYEYDIMKDARIKIIKHKEPLGQRVSMNEAAQIAEGQYLFRIDAHCTMSEGWDTKLKCACDDRSIAVPIIKDLNPDTWQIYENTKISSFAYLDRNFCHKWWSNYKTPQNWKIVEETMSFIGLAWMIKKKYFEQLGGFDDLTIGKYGFIGPEWSLKVWLSPQYPGRVLLRTDVICAHRWYNSKEERPFIEWDIGANKWRQKVMDRYGERIYQLIDRFKPMSEWI